MTEGSPALGFGAFPPPTREVRLSEPDSLSIVVVGNERVRVPADLPILPVRDAVVFPGMNVPLSVGRTRSLAAHALHANAAR